ncbi:MAG: efflux RND transporter periplasmic adaptor subunit [Gemmataceae bacterium]
MRRQLLAGIAVVLLALVVGLVVAWSIRPREESLRLPGIVEIHEVLLGPRIAGRVREVHVTEGDLLSEGVPVVTLEVPELEAQRAAQEARVAEASARLREAENGPRPQEKQAAQAAVTAARARLVRLEKGFRDEEKRQARGELDSLLAEEQLAREEYTRASRLIRGGAGSRQEMDAARAQLERLKSRVEAARARHDLYQAGMRPEEILEARAEVARLEAQARLLELGTREEEIAAARARLTEAQARLAELQVNLREAVVRTAEPCIVEIVQVRKGSLVTAGQAVARILRTGDLWVKTYVPETQLGKLRLGQDVQVTMDSYPGRPFTGRIVFIGAESEFTPRNVQTLDERRHQMFGVRVKVDDPHGHFKSGMAAEVIVPILRD